MKKPKISWVGQNFLNGDDAEYVPISFGVEVEIVIIVFFLSAQGAFQVWAAHIVSGRTERPVIELPLVIKNVFAGSLGSLFEMKGVSSTSLLISNPKYCPG